MEQPNEKEIEKLQFENDLAEIALEAKEKRIDNLKFDLKCEKSTSSTLRWCMLLLLILFLTSLYYNSEQLKVNRVISTQNDSLIDKVASDSIILIKYKVWQSVKTDSTNKAINLFLRNEKIKRLNEIGD